MTIDQLLPCNAYFLLANVNSTPCPGTLIDRDVLVILLSVTLVILK